MSWRTYSRDFAEWEIALQEASAERDKLRTENAELRRQLQEAEGIRTELLASQKREAEKDASLREAHAALLGIYPFDHPACVSVRNAIGPIDPEALAREQGYKRALDWLEQHDGVALISDDFGRWAVSGTGAQNIPEDTSIPSDISTSFFVEASEWRNSPLEAIEAARTAEDESKIQEREG